ncbi:MAG: hypothetical protein ABSC46_01210 [Candidatus Limnocylindrales bacterium]|jgi:hypothetical protein
MAGIRGLERWTVLLAAALVAACGSSGATSPTTHPSMATAGATISLLSTPRESPAQASPDRSLPPGVTVVDIANVIQRLDWSPNGNLLAVLTSGGTFGTGRADIFDLAGRLVTSFDAFDMAWVDDTRLMTIVVSPEDTAHGTATVHSIDGTASDSVPGTFGGMLGNGHGSVALVAPDVPSDTPRPESFRIWSNGNLGPIITGLGTPIRWSLDGTLLALMQTKDSGVAGVFERDHAAMYSVGGPIPGTLRVVKLPEEVVTVSHPLADIRVSTYFSPDGGRLATSAGLVLDLRDGVSTQVPGLGDQGGSVEGWHSGGLVTVGQDGRVSLWTPTGTTAIPNAFDWAFFGPNEEDVATLAAATDAPTAPALAVVRRAGGSVSILLNLGWSVVTWSADGICFMTTGTIDAQLIDNRLLRVELPAG